MHVDDRLATVLRQPVGGATMVRIQFRQLLDLLGTKASGEHSEQIDAAFLRLNELATKIPASARAAVLRDLGLRLRNPRLVSQLACDDPEIAIAAIARADLTEEQWLDLIPALPVVARGALRHRRGHGAAVDALLERLGVTDLGLPPATSVAAHEATDEAPPAAAESRSPSATVLEFPQPQERTDGIAAIVRRIEAFRKARAESGSDIANAPDGSPRLPIEGLADARPRRIECFDFATDAAGRINWTAAAIAPMVVGLRIDGRDPEAPARSTAALAVAFRRRQPIHALPLHIDGAPAVSGEWQVDAAPRFDPAGGRFTGYSGRMRRPSHAADAGTLTVAPGEADRLRQVLHELKTPINAIQGFAEAIQQQLFGPTPHEYRALAAAIAGDAARILAGFEDLERLAKLDSGAMALDPGQCDFATLVAQTVERLNAFTAARGSGFASAVEAGPMPVALAEADAERMAWRLLATLAGAAGPGERLELHLGHREDASTLSVRLPQALAAADGESLFEVTASAAPQAISAGMFGTGFALRLAAVEARSAGGSLEVRDGELQLTLPRPVSQRDEEGQRSQLLNAGESIGAG